MMRLGDFESVPPSPAAAEGTAAHWVAWRGILGEVTKLNEKAPNGITVDADMIDGAVLYADTLGAYMMAGGAGQWKAETKVTIPAIHEDCWGTPDFWSYDPAQRLLTVADYKYGHRYVEVFENKQMTAYAAGLIEQLGLGDQTTKVRFIIVQPRSWSADGPVREWTTSAARLRPLVNALHAHVGAAMEKDALLVPGAHCLDCPAAAKCPANQRATEWALDFAHTVELVAMSPEEVGTRLAQVDAAKATLKSIGDALAEQAMGMIRAGKVVSNYEVGFSSPRQKWNVPVAQLGALGTLYGVELTEMSAAKTPKEAIKCKIPKGVIDAMSITPTGTPKLVPMDTLRTRKIFNK